MTAKASISYRNTRMDLICFAFHNFWRAFAVKIIFVISLPATYFQTPDNLSISDKIIFFVANELYLFVFILTMYLILSLIIIWLKGDKGVLCQHTVTLMDDFIIEETRYNKTEIKWEAVKKICKAGRYILIYISDGMAHVIPKRAFTDAQEELYFYNFCKSKIT